MKSKSVSMRLFKFSGKKKLLGALTTKPRNISANLHEDPVGVNGRSNDATADKSRWQ